MQEILQTNNEVEIDPALVELVVLNLQNGTPVDDFLKEFENSPAFKNLNENQLAELKRRVDAKKF